MIRFDKDHRAAEPNLVAVSPDKILNANLSGDIRQLVDDYQVVVDLPDGRRYRVTTPLCFQYDGASIPDVWIIRKIIGQPYSARLLPGGTPHDWLYYTHRVEQWRGNQWVWVDCDFDTANQILRAAILIAGTTRLHAWEVYKAVSLFGEGHWDNDTTDIIYLATLRQQIIDSDRNPEICYG